MENIVLWELRTGQFHIFCMTSSAGVASGSSYRVDSFLQFFQEPGSVRAVHLGMMELEGDGQSYFEPMLAITAPGQEGIGEDAVILVGDAVELRACDG